MSLSLLRELSENYLRNPFFLIPRTSSGEITPLLHQNEVVARALLLNPVRILIADVIGLGKTIEALRVLYALEKYSGNKIRRVLVIVPSTLERQWEQEIRRFGYDPVKLTYENLELLRLGKLDGWLFLGRMDTLKKEDYFYKLRAVEWDVLIIDEAHRIEHPDIYRYRYIELARELWNAAVILLSATPHRGKDKYYLALLSALDPWLTPIAEMKYYRSDTSPVDAEFYSRTHNVIVYRRTKKDVNTVYEKREVFKPARMLNILLKPNELEMELLEGIISTGIEVVKNYYESVIEVGARHLRKVHGLIGLLSLLLVKRGTSSPKALVNTFSTIAFKRAGYQQDTEPEAVEELEKMIRKSLDPDEVDELDEEPDKLYSKFASILYDSGLITEESKTRLETCLNLASSLVHTDYPDTKVGFIARLVEIARGEHGELPSELSDLLNAKIIVFTEFKDTAEYIRSKLVNMLRAKYADAGNMVRVLTSDNKNEFRDVIAWLKTPGVKVLVATDVMSEGLNLQEANVLVNYEIVYSPVRLEQRIGRVWRYGQTRTVYVFNLFYLHPRERALHDVFFRKLYAITESLGKQEVFPGDEVYIVSFQNTIFDKMLERELGEQGKEIARFIEAVGHRSVARTLKYSHSEENTIDEVVTEITLESSDTEYSERLEQIASELVRELLEIARITRVKRLYPEQASREDVERVLEQLWGIRNNEEAEKLASTLYDIYMDITGDFNKPRNPVDQLYAVLIRANGSQVKKPLYYVIGGGSNQVIALYKVSFHIGDREISDVVMVQVDVSTGASKAFRGLKLVEQLRTLLSSSLLIDEKYGEIRRVESALQACLLTAKEAVDVKSVLSRVREYEEVKKTVLERVGYQYEKLFTDKAVFNEPELLAVFFTPDMLPKSTHIPPTGVWSGFEKKYLVDIVERFEKEAGREPERVYLEEHYDIYSRGETEERFIECKGFVEPRIEFQLTEAEYQVAKELGDKYWVYLVYGIGTEEPVVLAIRNPVNKLRVRQEVYEVKVVRYSFSP